MIIHSHGNYDSLGNISVNDELKIEGVNQDTQVVISACAIVNCDVKKSIAYKVSAENNVQVFAPTGVISLIKLIFLKDNTGNVTIEDIELENCN